MLPPAGGLTALMHLVLRFQGRRKDQKVQTSRSCSERLPVISCRQNQSELVLQHLDRLAAGRGQSRPSMPDKQAYLHF